MTVLVGFLLLGLVIVALYSVLLHRSMSSEIARLDGRSMRTLVELRKLRERIAPPVIP